MKLQSQQELYDSFRRLALGNSNGDVKAAAVNLILTILCQTSSSYDEAAVQWNELSNFIEENLRKRYGRGLVSPDEAARIFTKLNGDR